MWLAASTLFLEYKLPEPQKREELPLFTFAHDIFTLHQERSNLYLQIPAATSRNLLSQCASGGIVNESVYSRQLLNQLAQIVSIIIKNALDYDPSRMFSVQFEEWQAFGFVRVLDSRVIRRL